MELAKFTCLVGLNGAGKSTVLQFIDFLAQLVQGDMKAWLRERKWGRSDLKSKLSKKQVIDFRVTFVDDHGEPGYWEATYNPSLARCTSEDVKWAGQRLVNGKGVVEIVDTGNGREKKPVKILFDFEGSILSGLKEEVLPERIRQCKSLFSAVKSLDMLAPEHLRQRTRESSGTLGLGGQNLSAFLHEMSERDRGLLLVRLREAYPHLQGLRAKSLRSGWKQIEISEGYEGEASGRPSAMITEARHINDGMLRLMAILAELQSRYEFLLFDEIENGINPELVELVLDQLVNASKQVLVTTHSPMILNYLDDDVAREGVRYLYKTPRGHTRSIPFFSIPSLEKKLAVMGPGEAFADTNLVALGEEIESVTEGR